MSADDLEARAALPDRDVPVGAWVMPEVSYVNPARRFCAFCGRPIARRYWRAAIGTEELAFCDPTHAARYTTYPDRPH